MDNRGYKNGVHSCKAKQIRNENGKRPKPHKGVTTIKAKTATHPGSGLLKNLSVSKVI